MDEFSWATPDSRALNILKHFASQCNGIVEIGCGANAYWARQMHEVGIDILAFDSQLSKGGKINEKAVHLSTENVDHEEDDVVSGHSNRLKKRKTDHSTSCSLGEEEKTFDDGFRIYKGGPEVLSSHDSKFKDLDKRVLFLCYPDEDVIDEDPDSVMNEEENDNENQSVGEAKETPSQTSLGASCLEYFRGEIIIHVGELVGDTLSLDQAPWGRSSGPVFQQRLCAEYHCLLKAKLSNWLHVRDTISVWKRSKVCSIVFQGEEEDENDEEEVEYKYIPEDEKLPSDIAAPCVKHLLL